MKKIVLFGLMIIFGFSACEKEDENLPLGTSDKRLSQVLSDYKSQLTAAEWGWKATLFPEGGAAYSFLFDFAQNDRVNMSSDINEETTEVFESTYRLKAMQHPSLLFDTYSYLHILADPDARKSGGDWGQGQYSDFEFRFDSVTENSIYLTGIYNGSKLILEKATQDEANQYINSIAKHARGFNKINTFETYFKRLTVGGKSYDLSVIPERRNITFSYYNGDYLQTFSTTYYYTLEGLMLMEPFSDGETTITSLNAPEFSQTKGQISLTVNNEAASIKEATKPLRMDKDAAIRFFTGSFNATYYLSYFGFTIEGEQDALKIRSIPNFNLLVYWPSYDEVEGKPADLLGFVFGNTIHYGPTAVPSVTPDGRIVYTFAEVIGLDNMPAEHEPIVTATTELWTDPEGFYVVQTGEFSYDLVSAKDARFWISYF